MSTQMPNDDEVAETFTEEFEIEVDDTVDACFEEIDRIIGNCLDWCKSKGYSEKVFRSEVLFVLCERCDQNEA